MTTVTVQLTVPEGLVPYIGTDDGELSFAQKALLLYPFVQKQQMSYGRVAEILGVHKFDLIDFYCEMGIPYLNQSVDDLEKEMTDIHNFEGSAP